MELRKGIEALTHNAFAVARFVGERAVHGAWGTLANIVHQPQPDESNIVKGEE